MKKIYAIALSAMMITTLVAGQTACIAETNNNSSVEENAAQQDDLLTKLTTVAQDWTYLADEDVWVVSPAADEQVPAEKPNENSAEDAQTPPTKPDENSDSNSQTPPEKPDETSGSNSQTPPSKPAGNAQNQSDKSSENIGKPMDMQMRIPGSIVVGIDTNGDGVADVTADDITDTVSGTLVVVEGAELPMPEMPETASQPENSEKPADNQESEESTDGTAA